MQDKVNEWIKEVDGKPIEVEDSSALDQCFDLAFSWCNFLQVPLVAISHPAAYQIWANPTDETVKYFDFIPNTPNGLPQAGDIVVFNQSVGQYGHVSIALGRSDTNTFDSEDQNWNGKKFATKVTHPYTGVYGWLRLKQPPVAVPSEVTAQSHFNFDGYGDMELQQADAMLKAKDAKINEQLQQIGDDAAKIGTLQSQLEAAQSQPGTTTVYIPKPEPSKVPVWIRKIFGDSV